MLLKHFFALGVLISAAAAAPAADEALADGCKKAQLGFERCKNNNVVSLANIESQISRLTCGSKNA